MSRLGEFRRIAALTAVIFLLLSFLGVQFPWLTVAEKDKVWTWYFINGPPPQMQDPPPPQNPWQPVPCPLPPDPFPVFKPKWSIEVHIATLNVLTCTAFSEGVFPPVYKIPGSLANKRFCINLNYMHQDNILMPSKFMAANGRKCLQTGFLCATLILLSIVILITINITLSLNICKAKMVKYRDSDHAFGLRGCLCCVSTSIPLFIFTGFASFWAGCMNNNLDQVLINDQVTLRFSMGFYIAIWGFICMCLWYVMFVYGYILRDGANKGRGTDDEYSVDSITNTHRQKSTNKPADIITPTNEGHHSTENLDVREEKETAINVTEMPNHYNIHEDSETNHPKNNGSTEYNTENSIDLANLQIARANGDGRLYDAW